MSTQRLEHNHDVRLERPAERKSDSLHRVEVITGVGRRRRFSRETKADIVLESRAPGAVVSEVARRHGLTPQQLFGWRRELRAAIAGCKSQGIASSTFAPVVIEGSSAAQQLGAATGARPIVERGLIEIAIGEALIRVRDGVASRTLAAVLRAVKAQHDT